MPFVYLIGLPGMLVIPILSFILLVFCAYRLSEIYGKPWIGFILVMVLCTSPTVLRWMIANITDSLLAGLFGIVALILASKISERVWVLSIFSLIVLTSITRFCTPIWMAIAVVLWINQKRAQSVGVASVSILSSLPILLYMPSDVVLPAEVEANRMVEFFLLIKSFFKVGFFEVAQLAALDRALLLTLFVALFISLRYPKEVASKYYLTVFLAVWLIGAINGTVGVNFRYQLPVLVFACWVIVSNPIRFTDWFSVRRVQLHEKEIRS